MNSEPITPHTAPTLDERIAATVETAADAFWHRVSEQFEEARTGDLTPETTVSLGAAMERAIREWVLLNITLNEIA